MKLLTRLLFTVFVAVTVFSCTSVQERPPFWKEIEAFKMKDSQQMPPRQSILFIGSSSFTKWTDIQNYFPNYPIINRGFGGSSLPDVIRYAGDIIYPYAPKQIIIYCGENDLASSDTITSDLVLKRFQELLDSIRVHDNKVQVVFVSLKPSPSRWRLEPKIRKANQLISEFLQKQPQTIYVDIHNAMLLPDGRVNPEIFLADSLHMNAKGYAIWQKILLPVLIQ